MLNNNTLTLDNGSGSSCSPADIIELKVARGFDMGTQQVSSVICAHTETEGKGAGYQLCSQEVLGTGNSTITLSLSTVEVAALAHKLI